MNFPGSIHMRQAALPFAFIVIACAVVMPVTPHAAPLNLTQTPAALGREPAPNVIVSVDDSGSMGRQGIVTLQSALQQTFSVANLPEDRVRLAWQAATRSLKEAHYPKPPTRAP
jgi:type IV pilus assembly protein PilY1